MRSRQEVDGPTVIASGNSAPLLELVKGVFNQIHLFAQASVPAADVPHTPLPNHATV